MFNERDCIEKAQKGDLKAFEELVKHYQKQAFSFAYVRLRNRHDAEDIVQEVFWKVFVNLKRFDPARKFASWLFTIEMNAMMTFFRSRKKTVSIDQDDDFMENIRIEKESSISPEDKIVLFDAINSLNELDKNLILMKYHDDLSIKEIAEILKISEENVKVRIFRAKDKLSDFLKKEVI